MSRKSPKLPSKTSKELAAEVESFLQQAAVASGEANGLHEGAVAWRRLALARLQEAADALLTARRGLFVAVGDLGEALDVVRRQGSVLSSVYERDLDDERDDYYDRAEVVDALGDLPSPSSPVARQAASDVSEAVEPLLDVLASARAAVARLPSR